MHSNGTLPLPLPLDARCVYTLREILDPPLLSENENIFIFYFFDKIDKCYKYAHKTNVIFVITLHNAYLSFSKQ